MHRVSATELYTKNGSEGRFYVFFTLRPPQTWAFPVTPRAHVWCSVPPLELLQVTLRHLLRRPSLWNVNPRGARLPLVLLNDYLSSAPGSGQRVTHVSVAYLCPTSWPRQSSGARPCTGRCWVCVHPADGSCAGRNAACGVGTVRQRPEGVPFFLTWS